MPDIECEFELIVNPDHAKKEFAGAKNSDEYPFENNEGRVRALVTELGLDLTFSTKEETGAENSDTYPFYNKGGRTRAAVRELGII